MEQSLKRLSVSYFSPRSYQYPHSTPAECFIPTSVFLARLAAISTSASVGQRNNSSVAAFLTLVFKVDCVPKVTYGLQASMRVPTIRSGHKFALMELQRSGMLVVKHLHPFLGVACQMRATKLQDVQVQTWYPQDC